MLMSIFRFSISTFVVSISAVCLASTARADELICKDLPSDMVKIDKHLHPDGAISVEVYFPEKYSDFRIRSVKMSSVYRDQRCAKCKPLKMTTDLAGFSDDGLYGVSFISNKARGLSVKITAKYLNVCASKMVVNLSEESLERP
jgi:hypothetical protein